MSPKVLDAVELIGRFVTENWDSMASQEELLDELENRGFSSREISDAFRWIEENTLGVEEEFAEDRGRVGLQQPFRVLTPLEAAKLGAPAHGFLVRLYERGLIDPLLLEGILERIMEMDAEEISLKEVRRLAALAVFTRVQSEWRDYLHSTNNLIH